MSHVPLTGLDATPKPGGLQVRYMQRHDLPDVLAIEAHVFPVPWSEDDFRECLRQKLCVGMVAVRPTGQIVGYMLFEYLRPAHAIAVLNFAVHAECRLRGVGACMVDRLKERLDQQRYRDILAHVIEDNLAAQLFWRAMGFCCVHVERQLFPNRENPDLARDCYLFSWSAQAADASLNRVSHFFSE